MNPKLVLVILALSALVACGAPTATPAANAPTAVSAAAIEAPAATTAAIEAPAATTAATEAPVAATAVPATADATDAPAATEAPADVTAAPAATDAPAATAAPANATSAPAATAYTTQVAQKVMLMFTQIDDSVSVKVNDTDVFTHDILRSNQPKVEIDLTEKLVAGTNTIGVTAKNGLGSATLVGTLTQGDQVIKQWHIIGASAKNNAAFVDDSFPIEYQGAPTTAATAAPVAIQVAQCNTNDIAAPKQAQATLRFTNSSGTTITIIWRNPSASPTKLVEYAKLADGKSYQQESYVGHEWLLNDQSGNTLLEYKVTTDQKQCVLLKPAN